MKVKFFIIIFLVMFLLHCGSIKKETKITPPPEQPAEEWLNTSVGLEQVGIASWYGNDFHGKRTANGEVYDMEKLTAAHKYLPFHTLVEVENLDNNKTVLVRINDRGPFVKGRIIDLSRKAAQRIGMDDVGTAKVRLRIVTANELAKPPLEKPIEAAPNQKSAIDKEEITIAEIKDTGTPQSTEPLPPPPSQSTAFQSDEPVGYYLQAGAFSSMKNAKRQLKNIKYILPGIPFKIQHKDGFYKVISDQLGSKETAETFKIHLDKNGIDTIVKNSDGSY